jgi:phospholipase C
MRFLSRITAFSALVGICLLSITGGALAATAPTVTFTASPTSIGANGSSTLSWKTTNATSVSISGGIGTVALSGTKTVSPTATTTYTLTAKGAGGTKTATAKVTVIATTVVITATPATVASGGASTLKVTVTNAYSVAITNNQNSTSIPVSAAGGSVVVKPTVTTIYTATVKGSKNNASASVTVTVSGTGAPTVSIVANPATITSGQSSTLTVTATGATGVTVTDNVDSTTYTLGATGGAQPVSPTATTTYTATATGAGGTSTATATVTVSAATKPTVSMVASPATISSGQTSTLTVTASGATGVTVSDNVDSTTYTLGATGGAQSVSPTATTIYTATATGAGGTSTATATVTVTAANADAIQHVIFMMQENRTFDSYFGMLNPYRMNNGWNVGDDGKQYNVDGIDDKLSTVTNVDDEGAVFPLFKTTSTCLDDMTSAWLESYGDVSRYDFSTTRKILMDGYVHVAENYAKSGVGSGSFTDLTGQRAMAYYDEGYLNYYYYMASQFAISDRWFSPVSSKSTPNRIATYTGGTTQGLVNDPFVNDHLPTFSVENIFQKLDGASPAVSWKVYYTLTQGGCDEEDGDCGNTSNPSLYPVTTFSDFGYSERYLYLNSSQAACVAPTVGSKQAVGDASNAFCIDPTHIAPLSQFFTDANAGTLPSFAYIEAGYGLNDEHPGSGQSILQGQAEVATVLNKFMSSASWTNSVFFLSYDEGGGPYDHVPPVPGHTNDNTDASLGITTDIASIAVNPDSYGPCLPPTTTPTAHCDLTANDPGATATDTAAVNGFKAQLGFRLPNLIVSPFTRRHYVSHTPMDHTAVIKFVETRFIGPSASLTARDAAQPNLLEFFDFTGIPWSVPPTPPAPVTDTTGATCHPTTMGP